METKTFQTVKEFFKFLNDYEGEIWIRRNKAYNANGELVAEYNTKLLNYVKEYNFKNNCRKESKEYRTGTRIFQRCVRPSPFGAEKIAAFEADVKNALNVAADVAGTTVNILTSGYRIGTYCMMRQIVAYWLHKEKGYSKRDIAVAINRDRSTIYHAVNRIDDLLEIGDKITTKCWKEFNYRITNY